MRHKNITLSFPMELNILLHQRVPPRKISEYVAKAVKAALEMDKKEELLKLEAAYKEANKDKDRLETIDEWNDLDKQDDSEDWKW